MRLRRKITIPASILILSFPSCAVIQEITEPSVSGLERQIDFLEHEYERTGNKKLQERIKERRNDIKLLQQDKILEDEGYDPEHATSCGPVALEELFKHFYKEIPGKDISQEIRDANGLNTFMRNAVGLVNREARRITFYSEIDNICKSHGISLTEHPFATQQEKQDYLKTLRNTDKAALILLTDGPFSLHWIATPKKNPDAYLEDYNVVKIYDAEYQQPLAEKK